MTADAVGGVWTYALDLVRGFARRGIDVTIAGMGPTPMIVPSGIEVRWGNFKLEWMDDPWYDVDRARDWLLSLEEEILPDVIHLNGYTHASIGWRAPKIVVAHSCVLSWWDAVHRQPAPSAWSEYRARVFDGIRAADLLIAPSRAMLRELQKHYGAPKNSAVISNGRDPSMFRTVTKEPFILTAGRLWDKAKNIEALELAADSIDWPVYAAGEGNPSRVRALGRLHEGNLREWYGRASIYALPARYEPFGLSVLEAAFSGCALVLGDIPSLHENWDNAAIFVPPDDSIALREQLRILIRSEQLRRGLQNLARERASHFTLDRMLDAYENRYAAVRCSRDRAG
jgi:glycosyltransferase involved in cell wall biosynthesis